MIAPVDLQTLKQKAEQNIAKARDIGDQPVAWYHAPPTDAQILALVDALTQYRQWLVTYKQTEVERVSKSMADDSSRGYLLASGNLAAVSRALQEFDAAVSLGSQETDR